MRLVLLFVDVKLTVDFLIHLRSRDVDPFSGPLVFGSVKDPSSLILYVKLPSLVL